ncbi:L-allo-threonine aldolase [Neisseria shayeganii 871]|uniref:L-allo-threonine aldolase n=1 Tax=Neisseria shayeganii 871 TaxID=1032488 RepID=G4CIN1_9NEIS|nr:L-allo-threonine aldolase [Neisseria shayeganii 871]
MGIFGHEVSSDDGLRWRPAAAVCDAGRKDAEKTIMGAVAHKKRLPQQP